MFMVSEAERAAIRAAWEHGGEFDAMLEVKRIAPGIGVEEARECARTIAGWSPEVKLRVKRTVRRRASGCPT
jgi:hypothetical protein